MNQEEYAQSEQAQHALYSMNYQEGDGECQHPLPGDWEFGGATGEDPRTDPRWQPMTYVFLDKMLRTKHMTSEPFCIHVAKGWYREKLEERLGIKVFYITAAMPFERAEMIYSDVEGVISAS